MSLEDDRSARQIARSKRRRAGDRSAEVAAALMKASEAVLAKLELEESLRDELTRARAVTSMKARRRAERALAGDLRRHDLGSVADQLAAIQTNNVDVRQFHLAEQWRARLIDEGDAALAEFPGAADDELRRRIAAARTERATGRPPGAARALFRAITERLKPT